MPNAPRRNFARNVLCGFAAVAFCLSILSGCVLDQAFYYPSKNNYGNPGQGGLKYETVRFASRDGTSLSGWFLPATNVTNPRDAKGTVIHVHGNAENVSAHWPFVGWLPSRGYNVFMFDYRGFGHSEGKPNPRGVFEDTQSALDYVRTRPDVDPEKLLVFGQSLGGSNAIAALGAGHRAGIRAVAAEGTFSSYAAIANDKLPGAGLLVNDNYSAHRYIGQLPPIPLLLIHGANDDLVPPRHSERLFALAGEPRRLVLIPGGGHIDAMTERFGHTYQDLLVAFFDEALGLVEKP
ncbi:MAG: alpha/beta hydrolase [Proteobacteria bacterium]|nr:alpha/beta hydrolase [Pseudomonadota bacterium]MCL2308576.1 alpha/beta hydrolase [Pseudomonadota bacterium]